MSLVQLIDTLKVFFFIFAVFLGTFACGRWYFEWRHTQSVSQFPVEVNQDFSEILAAYQTKHIIVGASWCKFCEQTKQWFIKRQVPFVFLDIHQDKAAKTIYENLGEGPIPLILFKDGYVRGFDSQKLVSRVNQSMKEHEQKTRI